LTEDSQALMDETLSLQPFELHYGEALPDAKIAFRLMGNPEGPVVAVLGGISAHRIVTGAPGEGWAITRAALAHERSQSQREDSIADAVRRLVSIAQDNAGTGRGESADSSDVRRRIGAFFARAQVSDLLGFKALLKSAQGLESVGDSPVSKVVFTETNLDIATYALELQGPRGVLDAEDPNVVDAGRWQEAFLYARGFTISAGSNEIMRNLISERALKLPRDPAK